jgi:hypothetical protein
VFQDGFERPCFVAFSLVKDDAGYLQLRNCFEDHLRLARQHGAVRVPENTTCRASADWGPQPGWAWQRRIQAVRAIAFCKSHAELGESPALDADDPVEFARELKQLRTVLPNLDLLGGCCGTGCRHLQAICAACAPE